MLRELLLGFIKIHILHHASQQPVYGLWMMEELARHGYSVSPGTLYPTLQVLCHRARRGGGVGRGPRPLGGIGGRCVGRRM